MRAKSSLVIAMLAVIIPACHEPVGPVPIDGMYQLIAVNQQAPSTLLPADTDGCTVVLAQPNATVTANDARIFFLFQASRGLHCAGFKASGFIYGPVNVVGYFDSTATTMALDYPIGAGEIPVAMSLVAGQLTVTIPAAVLGLAHPAELVFRRSGGLLQALGVRDRLRPN